MVASIIKKIIQQAPKVLKKVPKKKVKVPLEIKPGKYANKTDRWGNPIVKKGSPFKHVDELATPLHRKDRYYPTGTEIKKLKEAGERISKWYRKKDKIMGGTKMGYKHGGLISGFPKVAKKGWK